MTATMPAATASTAPRAAHGRSPSAAGQGARHPVRVVTAASLFDGHDAAIHIMRRILQASGCEVIHLGHNRSVRDIVDAAIQEDAQAIAVSSYQGGHMEYFRYMVDMLRERGSGHVRVYGGGGGTIIPEEKAELEAYGVARIFHPEDGRRLGLQGMIDVIVDESAAAMAAPEVASLPATLDRDDWLGLGRAMTLAESAADGRIDAGAWAAALAARLGDAARPDAASVPVVGLTGTGGAGKSSLCDELVRRLVEDHPTMRVAVLSVDPTRQRTGGALLGDRIRMNSLDCGRVFMRSLATRSSGNELSAALADAIAICRRAGFDLIIAETSGIGQADAGIVALSDLSVYVMTPEFGAQSQLEKIEMLDVADLVLINKFDKPGALDALRDVRKAVQRAHARFEVPVDQMPVFATMASQHNDRGVNAGYLALVDQLGARTGRSWRGRYADALQVGLPERGSLVPPRRAGYLGEIADAVRGHKARAAQQADLARQAWALARALTALGGPAIPSPADDLRGFVPSGAAQAELLQAYQDCVARLDDDTRTAIVAWTELEARYRADVIGYDVRGKTIRVERTTESLAGQAISRVAVPHLDTWGAVVRFCMLEHLPGYFPFTAGVFPFKRQGEDPARMFAGEGGPWRTNRRFHLLSQHADAKRLSTAFDSVTLYGENPARRPDIWGKVGNSGVSVATVEDMEALYAGFDLCSPQTSVSMTINGPAPTILAFYFHAAIRQQLRRHLRATGALAITEAECLQPDAGGVDGDALRAMVDDATWQRIVGETVRKVRGTVQADILKEDQAQNTCIFSTEFALERMADVAAWFVEHDVRNFYSVSISGYHIAEAGANPITQLAFTLANGFTLVEAYRARGMAIDAFAPNFSFFFSNGMDPEYAVIGRVARRIWSIAMRDLYGANERSQMLKYHVQTSGRSLHAQEMAFNDIRTTLQALLAIYDNCNSLHTNAYDEAVTTPTEESVRRALAIQLVINREFGVARNENPNQGSFLIEELTELVEEAVLSEFERISERGGVLGAMERAYQRSKIQEESMLYEHRKHSGELPIIGVNTFLAPGADEAVATSIELARSSDDEKEDQLRRLDDFHARHADVAPAAAERLKRAVLSGDNVFAAIMDVVPALSLGQVSAALYEVGGRYRRNM